MDDCYKCGFWDHDREGCTCPAPDRVYACPIVTGSRQKEKSDIDRMRDEIIQRAGGRPLYCDTDSIFYLSNETVEEAIAKENKRRYERMKKKMEADDGNKD